jgi:hypothetical protein
MITQIFCLRSQKAVARKVESLLRKLIYPELEVELKEISDDYNTYSDYKEHENCGLFLRLFKASMIRVDDFAIVVSDGRGRWYYMGGSYHNEPRLLELLQSSMSSVFPAVAIMNRMMMMPYGVGDAFGKSRMFPWFVKPRDLEGVVLTDFQHPDSLEQAIRQVDVQLRTDIAKLCKRHMLLRRIATPDFVELSHLLKISTDYLESHRPEFTAPWAGLTCEIVSASARVGIESEVALEVRYASPEPLGLVSVRVSAPHGVMEDTFKASLLFAGGKTERRELRLRVKPKAAPYCPLEVQFTMDETQPLAAPSSYPLLLDVDGAAVQPGFAAAKP